MPRQRGGAAPRRPTAAPPKMPAAPVPAPARHSSTAAHPGQQPHAPTQTAAAPQQSQGPGLFGQMASTAAGVAVGSSIGHAIGGFFGGGSSAAPAEQAAQNTDFAQQHQSQQTQQSGPCATDVQAFRQCLDQNQGDMTICGWYLDQLKACQAAASQY